jgi:hypothetical protein
VNAAWLHRLGYDGLAALALKKTRVRNSFDEIRKAVRIVLARQADTDLVGSFCTGEDLLALQHAERLYRLYPDLAEELAPNAPEIVADLKRREKQGTLGKKPTTNRPVGYASWPASRQAEYLIAVLEDDDLSSLNTWQITRRSRLTVQRFGTDYATTTDAVPGLLELGEAAVPELIRAFEHDTRLTRCTERDARSFQRTKRITPVHVAARSILLRILRTDCLDPQSLDPPGDNSHSAQVAQYQRYWATYGRLPFDERMMKILTDPSCSIQARREAGHNLAVENSRLITATRYPGRSWNRTESEPVEPFQRTTPLLKKYGSPTIAEAIVAAMDSEVRKHAEANDDYPRAEQGYVDPLIELGDVRIVRELAKRATLAGTIEQRLRFASACEQLGAAGPMIKIARELTDGTITLSKSTEPSNRSDEEAAKRLSALVEVLTQISLPEVDDALHALTDPGHLFHSQALQCVVNARPKPSYPIHTWQQHPFSLALLRHALKDERLTGTNYYLRGDEIESLAGGMPVRCPASRYPGSAGKWCEHAAERTCDQIADVISMSLIGAPEFHPLRRDRDEIIDGMDALLRRNSRTLRPLRTDESSRFLTESRWWMVCIPHIQPLGRAGTPADVKAGRAVFELSGKGKVADVKFPTWVMLQTEAMKPQPSYGLVVQAEKRPDGKLVYGVIFRHEIRLVQEDEVVRIERGDQR